MHKKCNPVVWSACPSADYKPIRDVRAVMLRAVDQNGRDDRVIISTHSAAGVLPNVPEQDSVEPP